MLTFNDNDWTRDYEHVYTLREIHEGFGLSLGLNDYPIFDEEYRNVLNNAIYQHFCYRQIAADTPQLFVFYLNRRLREQMPTYNAIYKKLLDDALDPFGTYVHDANGNSHDASTSKTDSAADKAGLKLGDVITKMDDTDITSYEDLVAAKKSYSAGDTVTLTGFLQQHCEGATPRVADLCLPALFVDSLRVEYPLPRSHRSPRKCTPPVTPANGEHELTPAPAVML